MDDMLTLFVCKLEVKEVLKGSVEPGAVVTVEQEAFMYTEEQRLKPGETHLFFLTESFTYSFTKNDTYFLQPPAAGYPLIQDGRIYSTEYNHLLANGMTLKEAKSQINAVVANEQKE